MQRTDRWPDDYEPDGQKSRPGSRRNSSSLSRRNSVRENDAKKSPKVTAPGSSNSTPKKVVKDKNLDLVVTGKQILKRCDRASSLPATHHRRPSADSTPRRRGPESPKRAPPPPAHSHDTSLERDMTLDLSEVSDFEDTSSKYGLAQKFTALATSTPKLGHKLRSASLQSQLHAQKMETRKTLRSMDSKNSTSTISSPNCLTSRDSLVRTCSTASNYRYGTDLDYSSVSPEYSGQSSGDLSPRASRRTDLATSPRSQDMHVSSCGVSSWQDCSEVDNTKVEEYRRADDGEWNHFWANYNNSIGRVPMKSYYDQCPTPYRTDHIDFGDLDFSTESSKIRSPDNIRNLNNIIRNEGLHLTPRETQNMIKCAHIIGNVLAMAIERRSKDKDELPEEVQPEHLHPEREIKKKTMTLDLKETNLPVEVKEEKRSETVTTQTDISLPNTKSAPKIFENILRQLSRSSIDVPVTKGGDKVVKNKEIAVESKEKVVKNEDENVGMEEDNNKVVDIENAEKCKKTDDK